MKNFLKASLLFICMAVGTYAIADNSVQTTIQPVGTVALAKKASANTEVVLSGKLHVVKKTFTLEDSTGSIVISFPKPPELKLSDNLFSDIESWDYSKTKNHDYLKCCAKIEKLERSLNKGSRFEKIRQTLLADFLYLAVPRGMVKPEELADGWGLLYINENMTVDVISHPENWNCPIENKFHLIQNIAKSNIQPICFANGINLDKNNSPRFIRIPKKRRY